MSDTAFEIREAAARPNLDRFDPRLRIVATVAVVIAVLAVRSPVLLTALLPMALASAVVCGATAGEVLRRLAHVEGFLAVLVVLLPLTVPGPDFAAIGPLTLSQPGVERAVLILLRVNLAALAILTLLGGLEPVRLGHALARLGVPAKLVHLLLFAARWVALVKEEAGRLHEALRARAFRASTSRHTLRTLAHFIGQLLVRAFERAERVDEAMRCRAFAGRFALIDGTDFCRRDAVFAAGLTFGLVFLLVVDRIA